MGEIIFQFPFAGGNNKVKETEKLLNKMFIEADNILNNQGIIYITVPKFWASRFKMDELSKRTNFKIIEIKKFEFDKFPGYEHRITDVDKAASSIRESYTFIYQKR
ncbi:Rossmann-like fold-containing protein [Rapidithrix thailandica]|uniref:Rossmann-like fold-containing protein n=1 Tax=Rapidithrix thailandica TaxID=413964 RepID=A0AAW9SCZ5_9BACT